ncbi:hypothetical protein D3C87_1395480 [compost metagenome]
MIGANQIGPAKLVLQITDQLMRIIAQENRTDSALALCHQNRPKGTLADGKANVVVVAGCAVLGGFHAQ